jgi:hypothetical protein
MNLPTSAQARLVIVGATGMVGGYALRYALAHAAVAQVTTIGRRSLGISHPKLKDVLGTRCQAIRQVELENGCQPSGSRAAAGGLPPAHRQGQVLSRSNSAGPVIAFSTLFRL